MSQCQNHSVKIKYIQLYVCIMPNIIMRPVINICLPWRIQIEYNCCFVHPQLPYLNVKNIYNCYKEMNTWHLLPANPSSKYSDINPMLRSPRVLMTNYCRIKKINPEIASAWARALIRYCIIAQTTYLDILHCLLNIVHKHKVNNKCQAECVHMTSMFIILTYMYSSNENEVIYTYIYTCISTHIYLYTAI